MRAYPPSDRRIVVLSLLALLIAAGLVIAVNAVQNGDWWSWFESFFSSRCENIGSESPKW